MQVPLYVNYLFILTTVLTVVLFYFAANKSINVIMLLLVWMLVQAVIALTGFYLETYSLPPRFLLMVAPPILLIIFMFLTKNGKSFIGVLNLKTLTILHTIRIPVEIVLWLLFLNNKVPELMTFEGRNFDILAGLTAPIIYVFAFKNGGINKTLLIGWNIICIALLLNIVVNAILSVPTNFQQFAFNQPNIGLLKFPMVWLPSLVVPIVLFSHLAALYKILKKS